MEELVEAEESGASWGRGEVWYRPSEERLGGWRVSEEKIGGRVSWFGFWLRFRLWRPVWVDVGR